ncbi:hypothetical protein L7F22_044971 [Adiantum nelumboides]|nr:hypothetical protein [Adiantum nelumboides]
MPQQQPPPPPSPQVPIPPLPIGVAGKNQMISVMSLVDKAKGEVSECNKGKEKGKAKVEDVNTAQLKQDSHHEESSQPKERRPRGRPKKQPLFKPRRKIDITDFTQGESSRAYNLAEDVSLQSPKIIWPRLLHLAPKGTDWPEFKKALKEEYFLEDSQRVTKQSFMKCINQKNKGLSARELLQEFEKKYEQLSLTKQPSVKSERVELFVPDADARLQKSLVQLLKDATGDLGLTLDWKLVLEAANMIVKCQMRVDKLIVADASDTSDEENKDKLTSSKHKLEEPVLDDLVKGIQELNLNLKAVKLEGLSKKGSTSESW